MDTAFEHPRCPAVQPAPSSSSKPLPVLPIDHVPSTIHNDALVYLAVAVAAFAAVPTFFWLKDKQHKVKERRRSRAVVANLKAKLDASRALESASAVAISVPPEPSLVDEQEELDVDEAESVKEKKKRSKDRRKRGRDREPSRPVRSKPPSRRPTSPEPARVERKALAPEYTPRAPEMHHLSQESTCMPDIASPTPVSMFPTSFCPPAYPSPSPSRSESSSHPGPSRSASASPTTAPLTPPSLPVSHSLPPIVSVTTEAWAPHLPHDDPAWDWDGQSSTYSAGSPSREPIKAKPASMPAPPSLVFPTLNAHPPPGASLVTQIASLKGALEASRTREDKLRREAERWSKECDLVKWRANEAANMWRRREAELQTQMHHLVHQLQTLTHAMQAASTPSPTAAFMHASPFPLAMPFPSPHQHHSFPFGGGLHPFDHRPTPSPRDDAVSEGLAEAILKRPSSIRSATASSSRSASRAMRRGGSDGCHDVTSEPDPQDATEVVEFEFPTLLKRRVPSPSMERSHDATASADDVEIFS